MLVAVVSAGLLGSAAVEARATTWEYDVAVRHSVPWYGEVIPCDYSAANGSGGNVCFEQYGDVFHVWDTHQDGQSVGVQWKLADGSRAGICRDKLGASSEPADCDKNFPEGMSFSMRYGYCDGDLSPCTAPGQYNHWGAWVSART